MEKARGLLGQAGLVERYCVQRGMSEGEPSHADQSWSGLVDISLYKAESITNK